MCRFSPYMTGYVQVGVTLVAQGAQTMGGSKDIISEFQASKNHPAWPPVSEAVESLRAHFLDLCCGPMQYQM